MEDKIHKIFEDVVNTALRTEVKHGFRPCVDKKDNISLAEGITTPVVCPSGTKKIVDVVISPKHFGPEVIIWSKQEK